MLFQQDLWMILLLLAVVPAVCEELAFRGFIFGGLLRQQGVLRAIVVSAILFGFAHAFLQQSITASIMGLVLGLIAWRTGGVLCTILVHAINNSLTMTMAWCGKNGWPYQAAELGHQSVRKVGVAQNWQFTASSIAVDAFFQRSVSRTSRPGQMV